MMRGVEKQNSVMKTSCLLGVFKEDARTRSEFLALLGHDVTGMLLTVSKRLEFSASRRLFRYRPGRTRENVAAFGPETAARYGTGRNYVAYFVFSGEINPGNGMLVNISEIKSRVEEVLHARFDQQVLERRSSDFPRPAADCGKRRPPAFRRGRAAVWRLRGQPAACHLVETPERSATFYAGGVCEANYWLEFSAARQTMSPHLSAAENEALFGVAVARRTGMGIITARADFPWWRGGLQGRSCRRPSVARCPPRSVRNSITRT